MVKLRCTERASEVDSKPLSLVGVAGRYSNVCAQGERIKDEPYVSRSETSSSGITARCRPPTR